MGTNQEGHWEGFLSEPSYSNNFSRFNNNGKNGNSGGS
jgi:hypothetical protein